MKMVGQIREIYKKGNFPSINDLISDNAIKNKADVLAYLNSCDVIAVAPGRSVDVISGKPIAGTLKMYSDGEYAWRSDVVYYFDKYNMDLGEDFLKHINVMTA